MTQVRLYTASTIMEMLSAMPYSILARKLAKEHKTTPKMGRLMVKEAQREVWLEDSNNKEIDRFDGVSVPKMPDFAIIQCQISGLSQLVPPEEVPLWGKVTQIL